MARSYSAECEHVRPPLPSAEVDFGISLKSTLENDTPSPEEGKASSNYDDIMRCLSPEQLPVLNALAREFAVCDHWHSSMPGPTWPNRFFAHAASSGGLDDSPTNDEMFAWKTFHGFEFKNGTVFEALAAKSATPWRLYTGGDFPNVAALKGIHHPQLLPFNEELHNIRSIVLPTARH
jgi:hypothetical protein